MPRRCATRHASSSRFGKSYRRLSAPSRFLILLLTAIGVLANLAVGGWVFSPKLLAPDANRINPLSGLRRLFSREGLAEVVKALLKVLVIGGVAYIVLRDSIPATVNLARESWSGAFASVAGLATHALLYFAAALAFVVAIEVPYQIWSHRGRLRMTRQELRDEMREPRSQSLTPSAGCAPCGAASPGPA